jgi:hypothetical protein
LRLPNHGRRPLLGSQEEFVPTHLYKYRGLGPPDSQQRRFLQRTFSHNEVYFASPVEFNDPFDCRVHLSFDGSDEEWLNRLRKLAERESHLSAEDKEARARSWLAAGGHKDPNCQAAMVAQLQSDANNIGIYCVSTRRNSLAMWPRYADGHRGICLEFEHLEGLFGPLPTTQAALDVHYRDRMPVVQSIGSDDTDAVVAHLLTKSSEWRDEHEHRFIDLAGRGTRHFNSRALVGVIFGCRTPATDRKLIEEWIASGPCAPSLYEAVMKRDEYALEIIDYIEERT